jgi:hypothetical protein
MPRHSGQIDRRPDTQTGGRGRNRASAGRWPDFRLNRTPT